MSYFPLKIQHRKNKMNRLTTSIVLAIALGSLVNISADELTADIAAIKEATATERPALIKEFRFELGNMGEEQRIRAMHKLREKMPELAQKIQSEEMELKINEIKNAEPAKRVELMNKFKLELAQMNEEERAETIAQMQKQMNKNQVKTAEQTQEQKRIQTKVQQQQMDQIQNMNKTEQMNQRQGADQFRQETIINSSQTQTQGFGKQ